jgi:nucleoside-diphosphate-sugar epimerase
MEWARWRTEHPGLAVQPGQEEAKPMRVVVTGCQGFIGRHLIARLREQDVDILGIGARPAPEIGPEWSRYQWWGQNSPTIQLPSEWEDQPFILVDLAWDMARPPTYQPHAEHILRCGNILDQLTPRGLRGVIGIGSAEEYGQRSGILRDDDPPLGEVSAYGWGKCAARSLMHAWSAATGNTALWLRPFVVYGPGQSGNMVIPYAVRQLLAGHEALFSDGEQRRDFVYLDDVVEALYRACQVVVRWPAGFQAINVATGCPTRVRDLLEYLARICNAQARFRFGVIARRRGEPAVQVADPTRAFETLRWRAQVDWREGMERIAHSIRRPEKLTA